MWLNLLFLLHALNKLTSHAFALRVIEISEFLQSPQAEDQNDEGSEDMPQDYQNLQQEIQNENLTDKTPPAGPKEPSVHDTRKNINYQRAKNSDDPKDKTLKDKIDRLVEQTIEDTERKMATINEVKEHGKYQAPYKIGFILNMVKKSREVQNELFNVAVKHRDDWKSLEQMKIFELMVHTNVDTTNLVRQMVEIHVQYANLSHIPYEKKRVVLLRRAASENLTSNKNELKKSQNKQPLTGRSWQNKPLRRTITNEIISMERPRLSKDVKTIEDLKKIKVLLDVDPTAFP